MTLPLENLDDLTFDDLIRDAISRIPVYAPGWTDHNKSDPGITLIELFAWLVEMQIYRLNRISDRSYLKFFALLGIEGPRQAEPARVDVTFSLTGEDVILPAGTQVAATKNDIIFRTERNLNVLDLVLSKIMSISSDLENIIDVEAGFGDLKYFLAFGELAKDDVALYLGLKSKSRCKYNDRILSLAFYLYDAPTTPKCDGSAIKMSDFFSWESLSDLSTDGMGKWTSMEIAIDETNVLSYSGKIELKFMKEPLCSKVPPTDVIPSYKDGFADLFWIRCKILVDAKDAFDSPPRIECILINTVSASEGARYALKEEKSSGQPGMTIVLEHSPVYQIRPPPDLEPMSSSSNLNQFHIKPEGEKSLVWVQAIDLDSSGPDDRHFLLDAEKGIISFGDGIHGAIPPGDCDILLHYISGAGEKGNVPEGAIDKILPEPDASKSLYGLIAEKNLKVENMRAGKGALPAETLDEAKSRARRSLKAVNRAVTVSDYEELAYQTPGVKVARAKAIPSYHPLSGFEVHNAVTVIVVPKSLYSQPFPSKRSLRAVFEHLDRHRLLTTRLFVYPPVYVKINVKAKIVARNRWDAWKVSEKVCKNLGNFLSPLSGGLDGGGWPFGRPVYLSEIYKIAAETDGVDFVYDVSLEGTIIDITGRQTGATNDGGDIIIPEYGLVYPDPDIGLGIVITGGSNQ